MKLLIPNVDYWMQAQTQQRYSLQGLLDMIEAFKSGLEHAYTKDDLLLACESTFHATCDVIFKSEYASKYSSAFKVELMDPKRLPDLIKQLKDKFDVYINRFGAENFHLYLSRIMQFSNYHCPSESVVVEGLLRRLGKPDVRLIYPIVDGEQEVLSSVLSKLDLDQFAGIDKEIGSNTAAIENGKL